MVMSFINPGTKWSQLIANNTISSAFSVSTNEGYNGIGAGKDVNTIILQATLSTLLGGATRNLNIGIDKLKLRLNHADKVYGSASTLSSSLQSLIRNYQTRAAVVTTVVSRGGNGLNNTMEEKPTQ